MASQFTESGLCVGGFQFFGLGLHRASSFKQNYHQCAFGPKSVWVTIHILLGNRLGLHHNQRLRCYPVFFRFLDSQSWLLKSRLSWRFMVHGWRLHRFRWSDRSLQTRHEANLLDTDSFCSFTLYILTGSFKCYSRDGNDQNVLFASDSPWPSQQQCDT